MKTILAVAAAIFLMGCASSAVVVGKARPPISVSAVKLYLTPPAKYEEIAVLEASSKASLSFTDQSKMDTVIARLKEEAAKLGANGILIKSTGDNLFLGAADGKAGSGIAIFVIAE